MNREATLSDALSDVDVAIAARDYDHAIALTNELLVAYPDAIGLWRAKARAYEAAGQMLSAAESFGRVLDFLPSDHVAMSALAQALSTGGNANEARVWARQALDYLPADREPVLQRIASSVPENLQTVGTSDAIAYTPDKSSQLLKTALAQTHAGLLGRGVSLLQQVVARQPDRIDAKVALAHALWKNNARIAASDISTSILDEQPDCLNAHLILLQFWHAACVPQQEKYHFDAIERFDPDHRVSAQLLGPQSPLPVIDVPAMRPLALMPATKPAEEDAQSRADWVDNLVAAASSAPKPLERMDRAGMADEGKPLARSTTGPSSNGTTEADDAGNTGQANDEMEMGNDSSDIDIDIESITRLEWMPDEATEDIKDGFDLSWLSMTPADGSGGFVPSRLTRATPDAKDGVPEQIEALEWQGGSGDSTSDVASETEAKNTEDKPDLAQQADVEVEQQSVSERDVVLSDSANDDPGMTGQIVEAALVEPAVEKETPASAPTEMPGAELASPSGPVLVTNNLNDLMDEAQRALSESRLTDAATFFKKIIPLLRGRPLDALIAELLSATKAHPSKAMFDVLGLAYARKRDLPAALEAYRTAMAFDE